MRLYLSSLRLGDNPERLVQLAGRGRDALVIVNACDGFEPGERPGRVEREIQSLRELGFSAEELDLRDYFAGGPASGPAGGPGGGPGGAPGGREGLAERLAGKGMVWVRGGNAFVLMRAMRQSGFDGLIKDLLRRDALVYGGYSGGIAVLGPSLEGVELVSDPVAVPAGYEQETLWEGLGILPFAIAPHYKSGHPSSPGIDRLVELFESRKVPFRTLRDGEALIVS